MLICCHLSPLTSGSNEGGMGHVFYHNKYLKREYHAIMKRSITFRRRFLRQLFSEICFLKKLLTGSNYNNILMLLHVERLDS